jgi:hypothetical protein
LSGGNSVRRRAVCLVSSDICKNKDISLGADRIDVQKMRLFKAVFCVAVVLILIGAILFKSQNLYGVSANLAIDSNKVREAVFDGLSESEALKNAGAVIIEGDDKVPSWFLEEIIEPSDYLDWDIFATQDYSIIGMVEYGEREMVADESGTSHPRIIDVLVAKGWSIQKGSDGVYNCFKDCGEKRWCVVNVSETESSRASVLTLYS